MYSDIMNVLKSTDAEITFIKKDGTTRVMKCTLRESAITPYEKKTERVRTVNENVLSVWDLEANSWRSINKDTITGVKEIVG